MERALPSSAGPLLESAHHHDPAALGQGLGGVLGLVRHTTTVKDDGSCSRRPLTATRAMFRVAVSAWTRSGRPAEGIVSARGPNTAPAAEERLRGLVPPPARSSATSARMSLTCQDAWVCSSAVPTVLLVTSRWMRHRT
jgi:hypothetical protein